MHPLQPENPPTLDWRCPQLPLPKLGEDLRLPRTQCIPQPLLQNWATHRVLFLSVASEPGHRDHVYNRQRPLTPDCTACTVSLSTRHPPLNPFATLFPPGVSLSGFLFLWVIKTLLGWLLLKPPGLEAKIVSVASQPVVDDRICGRRCNNSGAGIAAEGSHKVGRDPEVNCRSDGEGGRWDKSCMDPSGAGRVCAPDVFSGSTPPTSQSVLPPEERWFVFSNLTMAMGLPGLFHGPLRFFIFTYFRYVGDCITHSKTSGICYVVVAPNIEMLLFLLIIIRLQENKEADKQIQIYPPGGIQRSR